MVVLWLSKNLILFSEELWDRVRAADIAFEELLRDTLALELGDARYCVVELFSLLVVAFGVLHDFHGAQLEQPHVRRAVAEALKHLH